MLLVAAIISLRQRASEAPCHSDEALAVAARTGDAAAIAELFERFRLPVTRFLSRMVFEPDQVEDLLQATFLEVARGAARYDERSAVTTWLFGVSANLVRHHRRSHGRRRKLHEAYGAGQIAAGGEKLAPDAEELLVLDRARACLDALSEERRAAFVLCELEGLSAKEAALALHCSETAIWKRVSDARRLLRSAMTGERP